MRIAIIALNFPPEPVGAGRYTGELARFLAGAGHDVHVVTAHPHYPAWRAPRGWWKYRRHTTGFDGATTFRVTRCPTWTPHTPGPAARSLHAGFFGCAVLPAALAAIAHRPEVVLVVAPTIACVPAGLLLGLASRARVWLHLQDREIPAALNLGYSGGPLLSRAVRLAATAESLCLRACHGVICISESMADSLRDIGVTNVRTIPNWVDCERFRPPSPREVRQARRCFSIPDGVPVVLFSGSMGPKQGLEHVVAAASLLRSEPYWFVLCGDGPVRAVLQAQARRLPRVRFLDVQPEHRFPALLHGADVHLVMQHPGSEGLLLPSKLGPILASGGRVLACASRESELATIALHTGGEQCPPHDPDALVSRLQQMVFRRGASAPSVQARDFACKNLELCSILPQIERTLRHP